MSSSEYVKPDIKTNFSKTPITLYFLLALVLYAFGFLSFIDIIFDPQNRETLDKIATTITTIIGLEGFIDSFVPFMVLFVIAFVLFSIILGYLIVWLMSRLAMEVTVITIILVPIIIMVIGGMVALAAVVETELLFVGIIIVVVGAVLLLLAIWKFQSFKRAGTFVEFSAKLVLDEKAVLWSPILLGLFNLVTGFFILFGFLEINKVFTVATSGAESTEISPIGVILGLAFAYIYLIIYLGVYYTLNAFVVSYASDWYRGLDPDRQSATKDVKSVFPIIIKFAAAMATVRLLAQVAQQGMYRSASGRGRGGGAAAALIGSIIAGIVFSIIAAVWQFINYFTLVSIVQKKGNLTDSIKDSASTTWNSLLDVIVGETGYGLTMFVFALINTVIWFATGIAVGYLVFPGEFIFWIGFGVIFFILSTFSYGIATSPMSISFKTFLYSYADDYADGFRKPSRLPAEFIDEFKLIQGYDKKRKMKDPSEFI
jgi:hypothetical protein